MKKVITHKFYLKHTQNGVVFIFTIFLLLIISILTITFFYLQFLEVDLIADETEYIQAFYLAEAGLVQGEKEFRKNTNKIIGFVQDRYSDPNYNDVELTCNELYDLYEQNEDTYNNYTHIDMYEDIASNKQGTFCYGYKLDSNIPVDSNISLIDSNIIITITGKGWIIEESEPKTKIRNERRENRREVERSFRRRPFRTFNDFPDDNINNIVELLKTPIVTSRIEPNLQEKITYFVQDIDGQKKERSEDQVKLLTLSEMTTDQANGYNKFAQTTKTKITLAHYFDPDNPRNRNKYLLWGKGLFDRYDSPFWEELHEVNPVFDYKETRKAPKKPTTFYSKMTIKRNKEFTLRHGLLPYFFDELTLEENSTLNTDGPVTIYVQRLILKDKAKLMGGTSTKPDKASPNDLIILAECLRGASCSISDDGIHIGSTAKICGHIFAPNLKVFLCKGDDDDGGNTRVSGSILTFQLVTSRCGASPSFGPIWVIYSEYLEEDINLIPGSWREVRNP